MLGELIVFGIFNSQSLNRDVINNDSTAKSLC